MPTLNINNDDIRLNSSSSDKVVVTGSLGIGTTSPSTKLHVSGGARITGGLDLNSGARITGAYYENSNTEYTYIDMYNPGNASINIGTKHPLSYISFESGNGAYTERMRITNTGNVGIGTTSPGVKLEVIGGTSNINGYTDGIIQVVGLSPIAFVAPSNLNPSLNRWGFTLREVDEGDFSIRNIRQNTTPLIIKDTGNVGIGTTSPAAKLHTVGSGIVNIVQSSDTVSYTQYYNTSTGNSSTSDGLTVGLNGLNAYVYLREAGSLILGTSDAERLTITSAGNVGIGTTSPTRRLHIVSSDDTRGIMVEQTSASSYAEVHFKANREYRIGTGGSTSAAEAANNWYVYDATAALQRFVITSAGNVGIGTTSPSSGSKLQVEGNIFSNNVGGNSFSMNSAGANYGFILNNSANTFSLGYGPSLGTVGSSVLTWNSSGNVGIGATSPQTRLQVVSNIDHVSGDISINKSILDLYNNYESDVAEKGAILTFSDNYYDSVGPQKTIRAAIKGGTQLAGNTADGFLAFYTDSSSANSATERVRINASGNVGIGTTSPTQILSISRVSTDNYIKVEAGGQAANYSGLMLTEYGINWGWALRHNAATDLLHISYQDNTPTFSDSVTFNRNGNVGIGTTSPTNKLTIQSNSTQLRLETASDPSGYHSFIESNYNAANPLNIYSSAAASYAMGTISLGGISGVNTYLNSYYGIIFGTSTSSITAGTVRMMITNDGNVGIGTTSPSEKLHVVGTARFDTSIKIENSGALVNTSISAVSSGLEFLVNGSSAPQRNITFSNAGSIRVIINNDGNLGIGTTAPQQLLHVLGATDGYMMVQGANDAGNAGIYFKKEDTTGTMDRTKGLILFHTNVGSGFGRGHLGFCLNSADSNAIVSVSDEKFRMVDNGDFLADGDVVAYSTTISDERYKTNITPIDSALDKVNQMRGVSFDWTAVRSGREFGVIAQEIEKIAPEVVSEKELLNGETMKTVSYTSLVPFLIESIKELTQQVNELKAQLDGLTK